MPRLDTWSDAETTAALQACNLVTGGGRAAEQARLDAYLQAQKALIPFQGTAVISQLPYFAAGVGTKLQLELQRRFTSGDNG